MNITIKPGAAIDDATQIKDIVGKIEESLIELDSKVKKNIPEGVSTDWSRELLANWNTYFKNDVPAALANMRLSADNLNRAVDAALAYSRGQ